MARPKGMAFAAVGIAAVAVVLLLAETGRRWAGLGPEEPVAVMDFTPTPERLARGQYLVENVMGCFGCHSDIDWAGTGMPRLGTEGGGGRVYDDTLPFSIYAPNISPDPETGAGTWSNEQFVRVLRQGIGHDGRRLISLMPWQETRHLNDEDLAALIAYVRSIPPVKNTVPPLELPDEVRRALVSFEYLTVPAPPADAPAAVRRGAYLVSVAGCGGCHTPYHPETGPYRHLAFGGGGPLHGPWGQVASANITPDASGIAHYDEAMFLRTIREGAVNGVRPLNHIMPWKYFRRMTDDDLKAIFAYLQTLPPVEHRVDNTEPPRPCKRCNGEHGYGDRNE
jgi:mono/diheme cytochrome c family protein